jgi:hypothetical protein
MKKKLKKQRIKALENEALTLRASLQGFMSFIGYEEGEVYVSTSKPLDIEAYEVFRQGLRDIEEKYTLKVS